MQIKHEKYSLGKSKNIEITLKDFDIKADIQLNINDVETNIHSSISGKVIDTLGIPIKNAIIKLMNNNLEILATTKTDDSGKYFINIIPPSNTYIILATYTRKLLSQSPSFSLLNKENKIINFTLLDDLNSLLGAINGTLVNNIEKPITGAVISLYKITSTDNILIGVTYSNFEGEFLFSELDAATYKLVISSLNYLPYDEEISVESSKISLFKKELKINPLISNGSISGIIADNFNKGIINADVILYKIEDNNIKIPVGFTQTNSSGIYAFSNVPFGNYIVKSNSSQTTNLENLVTPSIKITSTLQLGTYNLSSGILENNASVDYLTGFVTNLGGKNDGSVTLKVNIEKTGLYNLDIQYVSPDFNLPLKLEVNGKDSGEVYKLPITSGWTIDNSKIFNILTTLNAGENIIKFHGDSINLAPNLGTVTFIFNETEKVTLFAFSSLDPFTYNVSTGVLGGSAKVNEKTTFTDNLGGADDGSSTLTVKVMDTMIYYLSVKYLATLANTSLKIDINNFKDNKIYSVTKTKSNNVADALTFTIPILLNSGENTLKFHGDGKTTAPSLQQFILNSPPLEFQLINGILENGAKADISKNFVLGIGGTLNGSSTVRVNVNDTGKYMLNLKYVGTGTNLLKIDVNGVNTGTIYKLPVTKGLNLLDIKTFSLAINLNYGNNSLKFYGNNKDIAPNLAFYGVQFNDIITPTTPTAPTIPQETYFIANSTLRSPATYDKASNFVKYIGGKNNGACAIGVMVKYSAQYVLTIGYRNNNRKFKIDINNITTKTIYETTGDFTDTFSTLIDLKEGKNIIKFYGTGFAEELAPDLGDFTLRLNTPINLRLSDGIFENGAKLLSSGIITGIGGPEKGYFLINYFSLEASQYVLKLIFAGNGAPIVLSFNNDDFGTIYNIPAVKTPTVSYNININLNEGDNTIVFYGTEENYAPNLYSIEINKVPFNPIDSGYKFSQGDLSNSAKLNSSTGYVVDVGGANNGIVKLTVLAPSSDYYDLSIRYLSKYFDTPLKLDINKTIYSFTLPFGGFEYSSDPSIAILSRVYLEKDKNIFKFYGNGMGNGATLDSLKIFKSPDPVTVPKSNIFNAKTGEIQGSAVISKTASDFVENIGGSTKNGNKEGSVTIKVDNGKNSGLYHLSIEYLADATSKNLAIDINGIYTGIIYTFPQTNSLKDSDSIKFTVPIALNEGVNSIKFRGDGSNYAPKLRTLEIMEIPEYSIYNVSNGSLENTAMVNQNTNFTTNLGGSKNGSSTVLISAPNEGMYYLTIKYLSPKADSFIKIDIMDNTDVTSSITYTFPKTASGEIKDVKILTIKTILTDGENKIKFHGQGLEKNAITPDLEMFIITSNEYVKTYDIFNEGILSRSAKKSPIPGFITGIGGIKKGSVLLKVDMDTHGIYDLTFNYIEEKSIKTLNLSINGVKLSEVFKIPSSVNKSKNSINSFIIPIELPKGNSTIKFSSKRGLTFGPTIGQVTLTLNKILSPGNYSASNGSLKNKTDVDSNSNMVTNIGGKDNGEVTVKFNAPFDGFYKLELQVGVPIDLSLKGLPCRLLIDVNNISTKEEYAISTALLDKPNYTELMSSKEPVISTISVKVFLKAGNNNIRFYGNGKDAGPLLGYYKFFPVSKSSTLKTIELLPSGLYYLNYDFADGILENGATIDFNTGFVTNIGGKDDGFVTIEVITPETGIYTIIISYLSLEDNLPFIMDINGKPTGNIFIFEKCTSYLNTKSFSQKLTEGNNKIKFHGDGTHKSPDFSTISFVLLAKSTN